MVLKLSSPSFPGKTAWFLSLTSRKRCEWPCTATDSRQGATPPPPGMEIHPSWVGRFEHSETGPSHSKVDVDVNMSKYINIMYIYIYELMQVYC